MQRWVLGVMLACPFACCGCLPDNAYRTVLGEQLTQSVAVATSSAVGFIFGLGDSILNTLVVTILSSLT